MTEEKTHVFNNGLPSVYLHSPGSLLFTAVFIVGAGSRLENSENQGISRFYTNLCFQGNQEYPQLEQLNNAMDQLGLIIKPTVAPEYTLFSFASIKENFIASLDLSLKTIFAPSLNEKAIAQEKQITSSEIEIMAQNPSIMGLNKLSSAIFNYSSLGFDIVGNSQSLENINQQSLLEFKSKYYVSQNCLLLILGPDKDFDLSSLENSVQVIPSGPRQTSSNFDFSQTKTIQEKISQNSKSSVLTFGLPCYGRNSDQRVTQSLLVHILSNGRNNQRLAGLRSKNIVSSIKPWIKNFLDCGLFLIQASCPSTKENKAKEAIIEQLGRLSRADITQEELDQTKAFYQNSLLQRLNQDLELGLFQSLGYFFNLKETRPEEVAEKVKSISLNEINQLCQQLFQPNALSWVIIGPGY